MVDIDGREFEEVEQCRVECLSLDEFRATVVELLESHFDRITKLQVGTAVDGATRHLMMALQQYNGENLRTLELVADSPPWTVSLAVPLPKSAKPTTLALNGVVP